MSRVVTFVGAQACWWGCVLGAGTPYAVAAVAFTGVWIALHVARARRRRDEIVLVVVATALGVVVDSALVGGSAMRFPDAVALGPLPTPLWMIALWSGFATMLLSTLRPIVTSMPRALLFGFLGGPLSYLGGSRLGPLEIPAPVPQGLVVIGLAWAMAMAVLSVVVRRLDDKLMEQERLKGGAGGG